MSGLPLSAGDFWIHRPKIDSRIEYETCRTCATLVPILAVPLNSDSLANRLLSTMAPYTQYTLSLLDNNLSYCRSSMFVIMIMTLLVCR